MKPPCKWSVFSREVDAGSREEHTVNSLKSPSVGDLGAAHQRRFFDVVLGENLLQVLDLRNVVIGNIGLVGVQRQVENLKDRKSTRLNSSHQIISYAVFCLKKKKTAQY